MNVSEQQQPSTTQQEMVVFPVASVVQANPLVLWLFQST